MKFYQLFLAVNIFVFGGSLLLENIYPDFYLWTLIWGGNNTEAIFNYNQYYRLFTAIFLHGGFTHLAVNCFSLWQLGDPIEEIFGRSRFVILYIFSGLAGSLFSVGLQGQTLSIGSSGAIFGLLGGLTAWAIKTRRTDILRTIGINLALNIWLGLSIANIDNLAHLGGFVGGIILGFVFLNSSNVEYENSVI